MHSGEQRNVMQLSGTACDGSLVPTKALSGGLSPHHHLGGPEDGVEAKNYFQSRYQRGFLIPSWGNGLLIAADRPTSGGRIIITTYGLSRVRQETLEQQWHQWWSTHFRK
jgi:hypothetical protein